MTAEEALYHHPPDKVVRMPEGSWGEKGNHSVWINDRTRWMWEIEYRAENRMLKLLHELPWRTSENVRRILSAPGGNCCCCRRAIGHSSSTRNGAVDYGIQRFAGHATNFDRATQMAEEAAAGKPLTEVGRSSWKKWTSTTVCFRKLIWTGGCEWPWGTSETSVSVQDLGRVAYRQAWKLQQTGDTKLW